jgi:CheY-like chemotaxis protein
MKKNHSLIVHVDATADAEPDSEEVRYFLFQALRELLFNVVKHAAVSEATITLQGTPDEELRMVVEDEGCGFRTDAVQDEDEGEHFGLFSIQQRLALLGGTMFVDSKPDRGTRITLRVPRQQPNTRTSRPVASLSFRSTAEEESVGDVVWTTARPNPSIRVLLADDHDLLREGVARLLGEEQDIKVVGEASDGEEAVRIFKELRPDVVVMDITMPKVNGIAATTQIKEVDPDVRIIGLSMHTVEDMSAAMRSAGADAYLTKGGASETLVRAIRGDVPAAKQRRPTRPGGWLPN